MKLILITMLLGPMTTTAYRSVPSQTDTSPYRTSINERVNEHGVAVSQDLLQQNGGPIQYGDTLYIEGVGLKIVNDCMNKKHRNAIDLWVSSKDEEHKVFAKFRNGKTRVWLVHSELKEK